jgi:hypothetical protein
VRAAPDDGDDVSRWFMAHAVRLAIGTMAVYLVLASLLVLSAR